MTHLQGDIKKAGLEVEPAPKPERVRISDLLTLQGADLTLIIMCQPPSRKNAKYGSLKIPEVCRQHKKLGIWLEMLAKRQHTSELRSVSTH